MQSNFLSRVLLGSVVALCLAVVTVSAEELDLEGIHCVMSSKPANVATATEFKDCKIYFCCEGCKTKFSENPKKFLSRANRQLVETGQYKQVACPISGGDVDTDQTVKLGKKLTVALCCGNCKAEVEEAKKEKRIGKLVFAAKPFEKAFAKVEEESKD